MTHPTLAATFAACRAALEAGDLPGARALLDRLGRAELTPASALLYQTLQARLLGISPVDARPAGDALLGTQDLAPPRPGITLVGACMNRQDNLLKVLPSWLASDAQEIVIVDWSSRQPLLPLLQPWLADERLRLIRIDDEPRWILTHAFNVGLRFASHERLYKLDADIEIGRDFLRQNRFERGEFVRGFWKSAVDAGQADQKYVNGSFGAFKTDLREAGYYDERILTYGWDDSDLYHRLSHGMGLAGRLLQVGSLTHLPQADASRLENQAVSRRQFLGRFDATEFENMVNKFDAMLSGSWNRHQPAQDYRLTSVDGRYWQGTRTTTFAPSPAPQRALAQALAVREVSSWSPDAFPRLAWQAITSLSTAATWRDAQQQGRDEALLAALQGRAGAAVHVLRSDDAVLTAQLRHTLENLARAGAVHEGALILVEGEPAPGAAPAQRCVTAPPALAARLAQDAGATVHATLEHFETGLMQATGVHVWQVSVDAVAESVLRKVQALTQAMGGAYEAPAEADAQAALVTSLYDEPNLVRQIEYLSCVVLNLRVFDRLVVSYEARDGSLARVIARLLAMLQQPARRVLLLPSAQRPTFTELFALQALLPHGTRIAVANADIALDATWSRLGATLRADDFFVLSRRDLLDEGRRSSLIRLENGTPNTLSADVWVALTPFEPDFRLDYPIGSYHCDSYINGQASRSARYRLANPCLDVRALHLHDLRFNSSAEKHVRDREAIRQRYELEVARNGGIDPVKGAPWSATCQLGARQIDGGAIGWRPRAIVLDLHQATASLQALLWLHLLRPMAQRDSAVALVARLPAQDQDGALCRMLGYYRAHFATAGLLFDIEEHLADDAQAGAPMVSDACVQRSASATELLALSQAQGPQAVLARIAELLTLPIAHDGGDQLRCALQLDLTSQQAQQLIASLAEREPEAHAALIGFIRALGRGSKEGQLLWPFLPDLEMPTLAPGLIGLRRPTVSLVTSLFRGGAFLDDFLENAAHAAQVAEGEVVLVDANTDGRDAPRIAEFFRRRPELRPLFNIIELERDPGLYACWQLAIEQARGTYVSNANLDDRRSPQHTLRLVQALDANPACAGAAGSISAVHREATGSWFELLPNDVWFDYLGEREFGFDELYLRDAQGILRSHNIMHCMPVWRRSLHERYGYFDEERYGTSADWAFWLKCAKAGERFWLQPAAFGRYYVNPDSHNRRNDVDGAKERRILADWLGVRQDTVVKQ